MPFSIFMKVNIIKDYGGGGGAPVLTSGVINTAKKTDILIDNSKYIYSIYFEANVLAAADIITGVFISYSFSTSGSAKEGIADRNPGGA